MISLPRCQFWYPVIASLVEGLIIIKENEDGSVLKTAWIMEKMSFKAHLGFLKNELYEGLRQK